MENPFALQFQNEYLHLQTNIYLKMNKRGSESNDEKESEWAKVSEKERWKIENNDGRQEEQRWHMDSSMYDVGDGVIEKLRTNATNANDKNWGFVTLFLEISEMLWVTK